MTIGNPEHEIEPGVEIAIAAGGWGILAIEAASALYIHSLSSNIRDEIETNANLSFPEVATQPEIAAARIVESNYKIAQSSNDNSTIDQLIISGEQPRAESLLQADILRNDQRGPFVESLYGQPGFLLLNRGQLAIAEDMAMGAIVGAGFATFELTALFTIIAFSSWRKKIIGQRNKLSLNI